MERRTARKAAAAVAFAATLTGGAVVGAALGTPSTSGAASGGSTTTTAPDQSGGSTERPDEGGHGPLFEPFDLSVAAKALGLTEAELRSRLAKGDTLAEIAKAEGVDEATLVDALVTAGRTAIDEAAADAKANLEPRITDLVENGFGDHEGFPGHGGPGDPGGPGFGFGLDDLSTAAKVLGITEDQLRTKLRDGDTIADIAKAQKVDVDDVVAALVKAANAQIDERVRAGDLDADRAAELKTRLEEAIRSFVEDGRPGPWGHRPGR
jgi:hypothetical protein